MTNEETLVLAHKALKDGRYGRAIDLFKDALGSKPEDSNLLLSLASAHLGARDYGSALALVNQVAKIEPGNPNVIGMKLEIAKRAGDFRTIETLLRAFPGESEEVISARASLASSENPQAAVQILRDGLTFFPNSRLLAQDLLRAYIRDSRFVDARNHLEVLERNGLLDQISLAVSKASLALDMNRPEEASSLVSLVSAAEPGSLRSVYLTVYLAQREGRYNEVLSLVEEQGLQETKELGIALQYARALSALKRWRDAERAWRNVLRIVPNFKEAAKNGGYAALKQRKYIDALRISSGRP